MPEILHSVHPPTDEPEPGPFDDLPIPDLPLVPRRILALLVDHDFSMDALASILALDPLVSDQLLRLASCPLYGASQRFEDIKKATVYLGTRNTLSLALGISMFKGFRREGTPEEEWACRRLVYNAVACRELVTRTGAADREYAFLTAMVQDLGLLVLLQNKHADYAPLVREYEVRFEPFIEVERREKEVTHEQASRRLLQAYRFPADAIEAVERHHDEHLDIAEEASLAGNLIVAELAADFLLRPTDGVLRWLEMAWSAMFWEKPLDLIAYLEAVATGYSNLAEILGLRRSSSPRPRASIRNILTARKLASRAASAPTSET